MKTVGEVIDNDPVLKKAFKVLTDNYPTLESVYANKNSLRVYQNIMMHVIAAWEIEKGNVVVSGMKYRITTSFEEIKKIYGGTIVGPLL